MRTKIVAGNWKMNMEHDEGIQLIKDSLSALRNLSSEHKLIFAPPYYLLKDAVELTRDINNVHVAAQNCHEAKSGAFTGEISALMLRSVGVEYVILGHSERRKYFKENDGWIARKIDAALSVGVHPIFCCGEELDARQSGIHEQIVQTQLRNSLIHLNGEELKRVVIAYEPVWAIGTGQTATSDQAQSMHAFIREWIASHFTQNIADNISILYGGSCKPENAEDLFSKADVDGGLIGGASLKADDFLSIYRNL